MQNDIYKRLAVAEAIARAERAESIEALHAAYENACNENDEESAAYLVRRIRNKLLDATDKEMSLDRLAINTSSDHALVESLHEILTGDWARHRQALRDLPLQEGFPLHVVFPTKPNSEGGEVSWK